GPGGAQPMRPFILALTLLALLAPAPAHAQEVVLLPDPHARAVAVAWRFPAGSTTDPIGSEGLAFVHGLVLEGAATAAVRGVGAHVEVEVTREAFVLTLLAPVE